MSGHRFFRSKKNKNKDIEPQEVFLDNLAQKKEEEYGASKKRMEVSLPKGVLHFFSFFVFFLFIILLGRSFQIQLLQNDDFSVMAKRNILSISSAQLLRGVIYDRNYDQLVYNAPQHDLYFHGKSIDQSTKEDIDKISKIIDVDSFEIMDKIEKSDSPLTLIKRNIAHEEIVQLQSYVDDFSRFTISATAGRDYKYKESFSHLLGYIGKIDQETLRKNPGKYTIHDYVGVMGIEKYYEKYLTRAGEKILTKKDVRGTIQEQEVIEPAQEGKNIVLTIDARLQNIVQEKMKEKLEKIGAERAAVIALDPNNGEILAMASIPTFDNNIFRKEAGRDVFLSLLKGKDGVFVNRAISAEYPTGSTIKPLLAAAALEEGIIAPEKEIYSGGHITVPNPWNPSEPTIFRDYIAHGWRDMREAIAVSSNVYFYTIGGGYEDQEGLGVARIKKYLSLFGWDEKTGIDLPGERAGFIPDPKWKREALNDIWRVGDTYNLSIGQGYLSTTPLQVANSYAALSNGGVLYKPRILKKVVDDERNIIKETKPEIIRENFIAQENLDIIREGMKLTTTIGTARALQVLPVDSGAKTGTSQTAIPDKNNNWIGLFAPYDNPEIVMTVIIEGVPDVTPVSTRLARNILLEYFEEDSIIEEE